MKRMIILLALSAVLGACSARDTSNSAGSGTGSSSDQVVQSPSGKGFTTGAEGRRWPPRGRPNR